MGMTRYAWGINGVGQIGDGTITTNPVPTAQGTTKWAQVCVGGGHSLGIKANGTLWAWGWNGQGQLGDGTTTQQNSPVQIGSATWAYVSVGDNVSFGIKTDGTLWGWGAGYQYGTGLNTTSNVLSPTLIDGGSWLMVAAGTSRGHAIRSDGTLWGWGANSVYGGVGDGTTVDRPAPVQIGSSTWTYVARSTIGNGHGIKSDGTLWGWGSNMGSGQIGNGSASSLHLNPVQIGSSTWLTVARGREHALGIKTDGTLWAWGSNVSGRLGDGTTTVRYSPVQIGSSTWLEVSGGYSSSCALATDGGVWVWGDNGSGRLGDGTTVDQWSPVPINSAVKFAALVGQGAEAITYGALFTTDVALTEGVPIGEVWQPQSVVTVDIVDTFGIDDYAESHSTDILACTDVLSGISVSERITSDAVTVTLSGVVAAGLGSQIVDTASSSTGIESTVFTMYLEAIGLSDSLAAGASMTASLTDSAVMRAVILQAINQIVADVAGGADSLNVGAALTLVDVANAIETQTGSYNSVMLVAELIATLEAYTGGYAYNVTESGGLSDTYVARVAALVALLESAQMTDTNSVLVHVMQLASDSADSTTTITSAGSLLNALLSDSALATIRINIGGELFTGWVLNTDTMAPSEYQFADRQFNSACKHGTRYLMAADDGIYEFTDDVGVESVMTYIKTGKTDFGSDLKKRVVNSYMVYAASGQMVLKVTTSEFGKLVTRNYRMVSRADDTTDARRIDIGKGVTSRFWQFEVVGDGVDCDIDEIGMLPVVLSRRI